MKRRSFIARLFGAPLAALGVDAAGVNAEAFKRGNLVGELLWWNGKRWRSVPSYKDGDFPEYVQAEAAAREWNRQPKDGQNDH